MKKALNLMIADKELTMSNLMIMINLLVLLNVKFFVCFFELLIAAK